MENEFRNISLDELSIIEGLCVRTQNICFYNDLTDLKRILDFYFIEKQSFINLRNCGVKSNIELINICNKYEKYTIIPEIENNKFKDVIIDVPPPNPIIRKIDSLTIRQKQIINNILENRFVELSFRSSNALQSFIGHEINVKGIKSLILESDLRNLRNVGTKSIPEINSFINSAKEIIELVSSFETDAEITIELFNSYLSSKFSLEPALLNEIGRNYDFSKGLPVFRTLDLLIEKEIIFDHREKNIFKSCYNYYNDSISYTLEEIAQKLNITRERTRQLRLKLFENLIETFSFIRELEFDALNLYGIDHAVDYIVIDDELVNEINKNEGTNFNILFINKILSILFSEEFTLLGDEKSVLFETNYRTGHNWNSTYLVLNKYLANFDYEKFVGDVNKRLKERIEDDYSFHFQTYLLDFQKEGNNCFFDEISQIAEFILFNEFELTIDIDENLIFKRNIKKQVYEYAYEALENLGKPSKVDEIYKKVIELNPDFDTDERSIRASMKRATGFVPFGRSSTYGLKIWEEKLNIKGGTIRDITEEYLKSYEEPKHIDEITEYVNQYRNTNSRNIYSNLKIDESKRFIFFSGTYIGLTYKEYLSDEFVETKSVHKPVRTWDESFKILNDFVLNNNRLPNSKGSEEEVKLYRFLNIQLRKNINTEMDLEKSNLVNNLVEKYNSQ